MHGLAWEFAVRLLVGLSIFLEFFLSDISAARVMELLLQNRSLWKDELVQEQMSKPRNICIMIQTYVSTSPPRAIVREQQD